MNEEHKSIQLEQKIIHLKSEVEKYKTMLAALQSDQQLNHLKEQIEQLTSENAQLKEKCHHYEETISTQTHEMDRLSTELEETKKENLLLRDEIQKLRSENFAFQKKVEATEEKIKSLVNNATIAERRQAELEKENEILQEKTLSLERELSSQRSLMNEYLSFQSELQSFTSWIERIKTMEKDYVFLKENSDKILKEFEEMKKVLFTQKQETEDLKEEVRTLTKKFRAIEDIVSEFDSEKQKDLTILQKRVLHQQVEMEAILEKSILFAKEIEKISKQLTDLTEKIDQKREDSSSNSEMKEMLSQLVQRLTAQHETTHVEEGKIETLPPNPIKENTGNETSLTNSFLKLHEFIDETKQSIIVSPVKKKGQNHTQTFNMYPQKFSQIKNIRIETKPLQNIQRPFFYKQPGEDDDKSPNLVTSTSLYTTAQDELSDTQFLTAELNAKAKEKPMTSEHMKEKAFEQLKTHPNPPEQMEKEDHGDIASIVHEDHADMQEEKLGYESLEMIKSENYKSEGEHFTKNNKTNIPSLSENPDISIIAENVQETWETQKSPPNKKIQAAALQPAELTFHEEPVNPSFKIYSKFSEDEAPFLKSNNESAEEDLTNNKRGFFSLFKKKYSNNVRARD
ncbi:hypothetical protein SAMN05192569_10397 [Parageobacillus thermantarcticus]|uniref:Uncharacterized protein n=1 Tax=Parageobacillus thermantarcticus TaxID=186116 RepID=A0A1I0TMC2_9BACL|nr:hypothetical protein [Parageobacillus thermantarcticus]SFA52885.1 hypothetical protein SAMN05192569_10397 [Parageobacillus thermantarcticus]